MEEFSCNLIRVLLVLLLRSSIRSSRDDTCSDEPTCTRGRQAGGMEILDAEIYNKSQTSNADCKFGNGRPTRCIKT